MTTARTALVTGATQGLGLALAEGLARRMTPADTVYLTGRDPGRVAEAAAGAGGGGARVRGELLDVADHAAGGRLAAELKERHGGIDTAAPRARPRRRSPCSTSRSARSRPATTASSSGTGKSCRGLPAARKGG